MWTLLIKNNEHAFRIRLLVLKPSFFSPAQVFGGCMYKHSLLSITNCEEDLSLCAMFVTKDKYWSEGGDPEHVSVGAGSYTWVCFPTFQTSAC